MKATEKILAKNVVVGDILEGMDGYAHRITAINKGVYPNHIELRWGRDIWMEVAKDSILFQVV